MDVRILLQILAAVLFMANATVMQASGGGQSEQLTQQSLERIETLDSTINAVLLTHPEALEQARALDRKHAAGQSLGPLHGVPVLIKDNIETRDMPTTAGSLALSDNRTGRDAAVIEHLRESGLVILGKTNLSEWANFRSERSSSGWSGVGDQTRNPHDPSRSPCGSSSGSAAAVAAGMAPLALGTETNGSIICPAAVNGIVGIKPTVGLVSRRGVVPISHSQDTVGPMARDVRGAAELLTVLAAPDPADPATAKDSSFFDRDYASFLKLDGLQGKRIGVVRSLAGFHEGVDMALEQAIADMRAQGSVIIDDLAFPEYPEGFQSAAYDVLLYEFKHDLNVYLAGLPGAAGQLTLEKLIRFNEENAASELKWFQQEIFLKSQEKGGLDTEEYVEALALVQSFSRDGIDGLLKAHHLDVLISPSNTPAWVIDLVVGDRWLGSSSSFPARAGYPHITVPMGFVHELPVGLSFYGTAFSEPTLIEAAFGYEQFSQRARPPKTQ